MYIEPTEDRLLKVLREALDKEAKRIVEEEIIAALRRIEVRLRESVGNVNTAIVRRAGQSPFDMPQMQLRVNFLKV